MKTSRTILQTVVMTVLAAFMLVVGLASAGNALDANGNDWGPPPEAPHFEDFDGTSNICIDPPGEAWMVIHTDTNGVLTETEPFLYYPNENAVLLHDTPHTCIPMDVPVCPPNATEDQHIEKWATWDIGEGEGPRLVIDLDCTPEVPPVVPPVTPPVEPAPPVVPVTPVAVPVEGVTPTPEGQLPVTGSMTAPLVGIASVLAGIGYSLHRFTKAARTKIAG